MANNEVRIAITAKDQTAPAFASVEKSLAGLNAGAALLKTAFVGMVGVGGFGALAASAFSLADGLDAASAKTGFSLKSLQELRYAADQSGVSIDELEGGLARFTKGLGEARMGTGAAAEVYKKLGVDLSQSNEQVFKQVVATLGDMDDQTNRLALTTQLFGRSAQGMDNMLRGGNEGLQEFADKAQRLGLVLDDDLVTGAEAANDQFSTMKQVVSMQFVKVFLELAPAITSVGQAFADATPDVLAFWAAVFNVGREGVVDGLEDATEEYKETVEQIAKLRAALKSGGPITGTEFIDLKAAEANLVRLQKIIDEANTKLGLRGPSRDAPAEKPTGLDTSRLFDGDDAETEKRRSAIDSITNSLKEQAATIGMAKEQVALYRLEQLGATEADKQLAQTHIQTIAVFDADKKAMASMYDALADQEEAAIKAAEAHSAFRERVLSAVDPMIDYREKMLDLELAMERFPELSGEIGAAMRKLEQGLVDDAKETSTFAKDMGLSFTSAFEDAVVEGKKFSDVLKGLAQDVARIAFRKTVTEPLGNAFASFLPSLFGGFKIPGFATGGLVTGPTLAMIGEGGMNEAVVPLPDGRSIPVQMQGGGANVQVNVINSAAGTKASARERSEGNTRIIDVMVEQVKDSIASDITRGSGAIPDSMSRAYGLNRAAGAY